MTELEIQIMDAIKKSMPIPPTIRELCIKTGVNSTSVMRSYLERLERKGFIERVPNIARGILLKKKAITT